MRDIYKNINDSQWIFIQKKFVNERLGYTNFYIRYLNGFINRDNWSKQGKDKMQNKHLLNAQKILQTFDVIAILELPQTWTMIERKYHVTLQHDKNRKSNPRRFTSKFLEKFVPTKEFEMYYKQENELDYQFYHFAVNLSLSWLQLRQHETIIAR